MEMTPGLERFSLDGRDVNRAGEIAKSIPNAFPASFDITNLDSAATGIDEVVTRHGRLDCLVNNAAARDRRPVQDIDAEDFRR
jgi:NAD(P)-dependent dehydrogenase (short-subunit alcohol dehydrogenase family)